MMLVSGQIAVTTIALAGLMMWPPASGRMMLVPLTDRDVSVTARAALAGGGLLIGAGPFRGSLVVMGDRARLARQAGGWRMLVMAAPSAACGDAVVAGTPA